MATVTYLEAVNRTLARLREPSVSTLSGAGNYTTLIALYVNEAKEEVETAWRWNCMLQELSVALVNGTSTYSLTDFGDEFTIELVYNTALDYEIYGPLSYVDIQSRLATNTSSAPMFWTMAGSDANGDPEIKFYPTPSAAATITVSGRTKADYLTADSDRILVPWRPVVLGAYMKAISERGEDGGVSYEEAAMTYQNALSTAIAMDANLGSVNKDWYVD